MASCLSKQQSSCTNKKPAFNPRETFVSGLPLQFSISDLVCTKLKCKLRAQCLLIGGIWGTRELIYQTKTKAKAPLHKIPTLKRHFHAKQQHKKKLFISILELHEGTFEDA